MSNSNVLQASWIGLGKVASVSGTLIIAAVLARHLDPSEYGTYRQVLFVYGTLQAVLGLGLPRAYGYFLATEPLDTHRQIVTRLTLLLAAMGVVVSAVIYLAAGIIAAFFGNKELLPALQVFAPVPLLLLPTLGIEGISAALRRSSIAAGYQIVSQAFTAAAVVAPVVIWHGDHNAALGGLTVGAGASLLVGVGLMRRLISGSSNGDAGPSVRTILNYTLPLMVAAAFGVLFRMADKVVVGRWFGASVFAEYTNGFIDLPFVGMVAGATAAVLLPVFSRQVAQGAATEEVVGTWLSAWRKCAIMVYPLLVFFFAHAEPAMRLVYGEQYTGSAVFFRVSLAANFFQVIAFAPLLLALGETRLYAAAHAGATILLCVTGILAASVAHSPLLVAMAAGTLHAVLPVVLMYAIAVRIGCSLRQMVPVGEIVRILLHASAASAVARFASEALVSTDASQLVVGASLFGTLLLLTGKHMSLDYLFVVRTIGSTALRGWLPSAVVRAPS